MEEVIRSKKLLQAGEVVVVGVSGGADSVALLYMLHRLKDSLKIRILAVHIHHGLRGAEADEDAGYVQKFCAWQKIDCLQVRMDVADLAKKHKMGLEETGRTYRYEIFTQICDELRKISDDFFVFSYKNIEERLKEKNKDITVHLWENSSRSSGQNSSNLTKITAVKVALAHHRDDQAETILFHLIRGSGLLGCSGMRLQRDFVVRPLLPFSRAEIEAYLKSEGIPYQVDSTNQSNRYTRNRLRNEIIPRIQSGINAMAVENIVRAGELFQEADAYFCQEADAFLQHYGKVGDGEISVLVNRFIEKPRILRTYILREMLRMLAERAGFGMKDITQRHILDVDGLLERQTSKKVDLPHGIFAKKQYADIIISLPKIKQTKKKGSFQTRVFAYKPGMTIPKTGNTRWFDYDKIEGDLVLRHRKNGDDIYLQGVGRKSLKSYMIDQKIQKEIRDDLEVIACDHHIVWLIGYRTNDAYRIDENTKQVMEIKYVKEKEDEL